MAERSVKVKVWSTGKGLQEINFYMGLLEEKKLFNHCAGSDTNMDCQILDKL
jgi:hypothetical protein